MRPSPRSRFAAVLLLAALILPAGCSNLPTPPTAPVPSAGASSGAGSAPVLGLLGSTSTTTTTRTIGLLGGVVSAGNFTVVVPAGALTTNASITVSQPDPAKPVVNLSIAPASANKFLLPVTLTANASPMDKSLLSVAYVSYYNPSTGSWEQVANSSVSLLNLTVSAPLWHFSTYRVESGGKAGW